MRSRHLLAVLAVAFSMTIVCVGVTQASYGAAPSTTPLGAAERTIGAAPSCYEQLQHDTGNGVVSQRFEPEFADYNTRGADDFSLSRRCWVRSVDVAGTHFSSTGPADSEEVVLYTDRGGRPGAVITRQTVVGAGSNGSYHVPLHRPVRLEPGTYWLSVRANMNFTDGLWGWEVVSQASGNRARWKNPGGGFGSGCTTYRDMQTCLGEGAAGPDFMFSVNRTR